MDEAPPPYPNFDTCLKLRDAGFPQRRHYGAMYYVRPDMLINIADLSVLKSDGHTDFENIFSTLVFKPDLSSVEDECREFLQEVVRMTDGTYFAYSIVEEDPEYLEETGRSDRFIRARGQYLWDAFTSLYLAVKKRPDALIQALATKPLPE